MPDEFATRMNNVEIDLTVIKTDIKWIKGMCGICVCIIVGAAGLNFTGVM